MKKYLYTEISIYYDRVFLQTPFIHRKFMSRYIQYTFHVTTVTSEATQKKSIVMLAVTKSFHSPAA